MACTRVHVLSTKGRVDLYFYSRSYMKAMAPANVSDQYCVSLQEARVRLLAVGSIIVKLHAHGRYHTNQNCPTAKRVSKHFDNTYMVPIFYTSYTVPRFIVRLRLPWLKAQL